VKLTKKCLLIGLGQIGMGYDSELDPKKFVYTHARAFSKHPEFELIGAVDPLVDRRALFEERFHLTAYADIATALQVQPIDLVVIASPTTQHSAVLKEVLAQSTPRAILCEKPLSYNFDKAHDMVKSCEKVGCQLFVNYVRNADPGAIEIKRCIDSNEIKRPIKGVAWYSKGLMHNGSHLFNLLEFWLGPFVKASVLDAGSLRNCPNHDAEPDVQVEFELGKIVFMATWEDAYSHNTIELLSPSGRLRYEQGGELIVWQAANSNSKITGYRTIKEIPEIIPCGMHRYQWHVADQLARALEKKSNTLCTGRQALASLEAIQNIISQSRP